MHLARSRTVFLLLVVCLAGMAYSQQRISGVVLDASSNNPIPRATVSLVGTKSGAIANKDGKFVLTLPTSVTNRKLRITAIGYEPDTVNNNAISGSEHYYTVRLKPTPVSSQEIVVTSDASHVEARRIMREVIKRKKVWRDGLSNYECKAYSRWNLRTITGRSDTTIRSVVESTADGFWRHDKGFHERITGRKQTANFPAEANLFSVGTIINFYDDRIDFGEYDIPSPVADDAFDYYDFDLSGTTIINGEPVYQIILDPTIISPAFTGTLWIVKEDYTIAYLDLAPNQAVKMGPLKEIRMQQTFDLFQDTFWMPIDLRTSLAIKFEIPFVPQFKVDLLSSIKDYRINEGIHDSLFSRNQHVAVDVVDSVDDANWEAVRSIPLADDEAKAYTRIDSVVAERKTADTASEFNLFSLLPSPQFPVYNQVEGFRFGISKSVTPSELFPLTISGEVAYGLRDEEWKYTVGLRQGLLWTTTKRNVFSAGLSGDFYGEYKDVIDVSLWLSAQYFSDLASRGNAYSQLETSLTSLIYGEDYQEFYRHQGWNLGLEYEPFDWLRLHLNYTNSKIWNADSTLPFISPVISPIGTDTKLQDNTIKGGFAARLFAGGFSFELKTNVITSSAQLSSDASFTTFDAELTGTKRLGGWGVVEITGRFTQVISGALPRWRTLYFETRNKFDAKFAHFRGLEPFEFAGDRMWSAHLEHNFYDLPTRLVGLHFLDPLNLHWRLHASVGAMTHIRSETVPTPTTSPNPYGEIGFGIGNIYNLLTLEATWRLTHKRETNFYPTAVVAFSF